MAALPYMRFYAADYLADTHHLSTEEHGAYLLLLLNYWQAGKPLNNVNHRLAYVARMSNERWILVEQVLSEFFDIEGDEWTHRRVEYELDAVLVKSTKASFAGKESARQRANARLSVKDEVIPTDVERTLNGRSRSVQHKSNHTDTEADTEVLKDISTIDKPIVSPQFAAFWKIYPRKVGKAAASKAFIKALKKVDATELIEGVNRLAQDPHLDITFCPHASTWLNGERWADEAPPIARALEPKGFAVIRGMLNNQSAIGSHRMGLANDF